MNSQQEALREIRIRPSTHTPGAWAVLDDGKLCATFDDQRDAIEFAYDLADNSLKPANVLLQPLLSAPPQPEVGVRERTEEWIAKTAGVKQQDACVWVQDSDGPWNSSCGITWEFTVGGPPENNAKFCHHCGGVLLADPYVYDENDENVALSAPAAQEPVAWVSKGYLDLALQHADDLYAKGGMGNQLVANAIWHMRDFCMEKRPTAHPASAADTVRVPKKPTDAILKAMERAWCEHNHGWPYERELPAIYCAVISAVEGKP